MARLFANVDKKCYIYLVVGENIKSRRGKDMQIKIVPYNSQWPKKFEVFKTDLQEMMGELALSIDHIGSTAVPGLAAKDKIDIQITVAALSDEVLSTFTSNGYTYYPDLTDERPPQDASPDEEWQKMVFTPPGAKEKANIHVRVQGYANQRYALFFRDYLRTHPVARDSYGLLKEETARLHPNDLKAYYVIKEPVFDIIWEAAVEWGQRE